MLIKEKKKNEQGGGRLGEKSREKGDEQQGDGRWAQKSRDMGDETPCVMGPSFDLKMAYFCSQHS